MSAAVKGGWLRTRGVGCSQRRVAEDERCRLQSKDERCQLQSKEGG